MAVHTPVLLDEVLNLLKPNRAQAVLVDATLGEGGHAEAFLTRHPDLILYGVEIDESVLAQALDRLKRFGNRVRLFREGYESFFKAGSSDVGPDRIFFDLGISMYHIEKSGRGFSFLRDEPLDMRLNLDLERSAADIVNSFSEDELRRLIYRNGEERFARGIARAIVRKRQQSAIVRSVELADIIRAAVAPKYRYGRRHPATRTFQALRITVNDELEVLSEALSAAFERLLPGGRLGVISFHSLEDRIVKRFFLTLNKSCTCPPEWPICQCGGRKRAEIVTRKGIKASPEEVMRNPAARSANFRVLEKL